MTSKSISELFVQHKGFKEPTKPYSATVFLSTFEVKLKFVY